MLGIERASGRLLLNVPVALAFTVLLTNDLILKRTFPGLVTGKLSDAAGLFAFPLLTWTLFEFVTWVRRAQPPGVATLEKIGLVTAVVFSAVKLDAEAARVYGEALGTLRWPARAVTCLLDGHSIPEVRQVSVAVDHSDLLMFPFVVLAVLYGRQLIRQPVE